MATRTTTELEVLLERLEKNGSPAEPAAAESIVKQIAKLFSVQADEVALLELLPSGKSLQFLIPEKLRGVGTIPLSSATALAARTARERRGDVVNNFSSSRHATVFEAVPLGRNEAQSIQKIMSAPLLRGEELLGVVQISRKGVNAGDAGPDFTPHELNELRRLNDVLCRVLAVCHGAPAETAK